MEEEKEEEDTECIDSVKSMYFTDDWFDICRSRFWRSETSSWLFIVVKKSVLPISSCCNFGECVTDTVVFCTYSFISCSSSSSNNNSTGIGPLLLDSMGYLYINFVSSSMYPIFFKSSPQFLFFSILNLMQYNQPLVCTFRTCSLYLATHSFIYFSLQMQYWLQKQKNKYINININ